MSSNLNMANFFHLLQADALTGRAGDVQAGLAQKIGGFFDWFWSHLPVWIAGAALVVLSIFVAKIVKKIVENKIADQIDETHQEVLILAGRVSYVATLSIGVTVGLKIMGIDLTAIIAAVAFGIGFALKDMIMNFLAGVMILVSRHFTIGDFIKVNDLVGKIVEIQSRATILQSLDGTMVIVPNAELFTNVVTSFTSNPTRRIEVVVGVEYGTDLQIAMDTLLKTLTSHPKVLKKPASTVLLTQFADSSINFSCRFWVDSRGGWLGIRSEMIKMIKRDLDSVGVSIAFPHRQIIFDKDVKTEQSEVLKSKKQSVVLSQNATSAQEAVLSEQIAASASAPLVSSLVAPAQLQPELVPVHMTPGLSIHAENGQA